MTAQRLAKEMGRSLTFGLHFTTQFALYMERIAGERERRGQHGFDRWPVDLEEYQQRLCGVHANLSQGLPVVNWTFQEYGLPQDVQKALPRIVQAAKLAGVYDKHFELLWGRLDSEYFIRHKGKA